MKSVADRLLSEHGQGEIEVSSVINVAGATEIDPPSVVTSWELTKGIARGVSAKYIDNERIFAGDLQLIVKAGSDVAMGDMLRIDGKPFNVVSIEQIPAAGIAVCARVIVRG